MGKPVKRGNWGDRMIIVNVPCQYKKVSCYTCSHYCKEDGSCVYTDKKPSIDGIKVWEKCEWFDLDSAFMDADHIEKVKKVKGNDFFEIDHTHYASEIEAKMKVQEKPYKKVYEKPYEKLQTEVAIHPVGKGNLFLDRLKTSLEKQMNIRFEESELKGQIKFTGYCLRGNYENKIREKEVVIAAIEKLPPQKHKSRTITPLDDWFREISNVVIALQKYEPGRDRFVIISERVLKDEVDTIANLYYKKRGDRLGKINLLELRENGRLVPPKDYEINIELKKVTVKQ